MNSEEADIIVNEATREKANRLFPIFLKLENVHTLVIGAGHVGLEKIRALTNNCPQARVNIVALQAKEEVKELVAAFPSYKLQIKAFEESDLENVHLVISASNNEALNVALKEKEEVKELVAAFPSYKLQIKAFEESDLENVHLVISASNNEALNVALKEQANKRGILINVADKPEQCDFYLSSIVAKGQVKIAISTNGLSPTLAKRLKEVFQEEIPEEVTPLAENLYSLRRRLRGDFADKVKRLNKLTQSLSENGWEREIRWKRIATFSIVAFSLMLVGHLILSNVPLHELFYYLKEQYKSLNLTPDFHWFALAGFAAQLVDGALGMGYGLTTTTVLLSLGLNPAAMSR